MPLISLCIIARNEESVLGRCLDSVADLVDEIILVDTGSTDRTKAAAAEYAAKIYDFPWCDDFSAARNFAVSQAVGDYWMWLDADDVIEGENHEKLRRILEHPDADVVFLPYWLSFDESGAPQMVSQRERIFRRSGGYQFTGAVHEAVVPHGRLRYGDAAVSHRKLRPGDPDRNLHIYQQKLRRGESFSPREQYYYARELCDHGAYRAALPVLERFLEEGSGWAPDCIGACLLCAGCYRRLGIRTLPGNGCSGHFATAFPSRRCAVRSAAFFWKRVSIRRRRSGIISPWKRDTSPTRDSASRRAATISRRSSCACATTGWVTFPPPPHIMNLPGAFATATRRWHTTGSILRRRWGKRAAERVCLVLG